MSVRFGQILGSAGSLAPSLEKQAASGATIALPHPASSECVVAVETVAQLILEAGAVGGRGEALVLEVGESVSLVEVAQRLVDASSHRSDIVFTGLRPGERPWDINVIDDEPELVDVHPMISHVLVPPLRPTRLGLFDGSSPEAARSSLIDISGTHLWADEGAGLYPLH